MGDLFKGVHLLTQTEYDSLAANEELDPDVLYATPENVTELVRQHTEQIDKNSSDIASNKAEIENIKNSSGGSSEDIIEIKNTINEIILRDTAQDARLDNIETNYVSVEGVQTITGPKTFIEHIYLANTDGTIDRISHLNNNFIIHSGATNSAVLNIDEGLSKIYAFNKELAFKSDIAESSGTTIKVAGTAVIEVGFSSDPQTQIDLLSEGIDNDKTELISNINTKVSKSGDTMTGELNASAGVAFGNNKIKAENSGNTFEIVHLENGIDKNVLNYTHGGIFTLNNSETPVIIQGSDDRPTYVSGSGIMSDLALESDIKTAIDGLGTVFDLKGVKNTVSDLPTTGNSIGDVWYVTVEQVGYIWLNDGTTDRWERFGAPIDLSGYATLTALNDVINNNTKIANSTNGFGGGASARTTGAGGAVGYHTYVYNNTDTGSAGDGFAGGREAFVRGAGAAVGQYATAADGFAGGKNAKTQIETQISGGQTSINIIDAIQLGTGTNSNEKTLQVYDYQLMDSSGNIPDERVANVQAIRYVEEERIKNKNITWFYDYDGELTGSEAITVGNNVQLKLVYGAHTLSFAYDSDTTELTLGRPYYDAYSVFKLSNLKPNTEYTLSFNLVSSLKTNYGYVFGILLQTNTATGVRYSKTITTDENGEYNSSGVDNSVWFSAEGDSVTISQFQLEEGRYSTEYTHPYGLVLRERANRVEPGVTNSFQNDTVVEYWVSSDGLTWYRKWSSGWKECGVLISIGEIASNSNKSVDVIFPIKFKKVLTLKPQTRLTAQSQYDTFILTNSGAISYENNSTSVQVISRNLSDYTAVSIWAEISCCGY